MFYKNLSAHPSWAVKQPCLLQFFGGVCLSCRQKEESWFECVLGATETFLFFEIHLVQCDFYDRDFVVISLYSLIHCHQQMMFAKKYNHIISLWYAQKNSLSFWWKMEDFNFYTSQTIPFCTYGCFISHLENGKMPLSCKVCVKLVGECGDFILLFNWSAGLSDARLEAQGMTGRIFSKKLE